MLLEKSQKLAGANKIVRICANIQPNEKVLVITDTETLAVGELIALAAMQVASETAMIVISPRRAHGDEPPAHVAAAMAKADVVLAPLKFSMTHAAAAQEARRQGARMLSLGDYNERMLASGGIQADFLKLSKVVNHVVEIFSAGARAELTTPGGTRLSMDITGRRGAGEPGFAHQPGSFAGPPNVEVNVGPLEGTAQGVIVVDGSIPHPKLGVIHEPIRLSVRDGLIHEIAGGRQADLFRQVLADYEDPNIYNIAELGLGLNPFATITGSMMEDEGSYGTCHIGIGTNTGFGGRIRAKSHIDLVQRQSTLVIDGRVVQKDGVLTTIDIMEGQEGWK